LRNNIEWIAVTIHAMWEDEIGEKAELSCYELSQHGTKSLAENPRLRDYVSQYETARVSA